MSRAPRIDTTRNRVNGALGLLRVVLEELEDLHVLAYERPRVVAEAKVSGGERDYALDTHGDARARDAYRHLSQVMVGYRDKDGDRVTGVCDTLDDAANEVIRILRAADPGERKSRLPSSMEAEELASLLQAKARRVKRGEYSPVAYMPQPSAAVTDLVVDQLRTKVIEQQQQIDRYERLLRQYGWTPPNERRRGWQKKPRSA